MIERKYIERFEKYFTKTKNCWVWQGGTGRFNYGLLRNEKGVMEAAHRISHKIYIGRIPKNKLVLHSCDNPSCVNPYHLRIGTHKDNTKDMLDRGRGGHYKNDFNGSKNPNSKLDDDDKEFIFLTSINKSIKQKDLATIFNVHRTTIKRAFRERMGVS